MSVPDRLAVVAHELRSPVAALAAISEAMRDRRSSLSPDERRRLLGLVVAAVENIERLVLDASVVSVRRRPLDPALIVRDAVGAASMTGAPVRAELADALPRIAGDPVRLRQALDNLISNALGHSPVGAEVVVEGRCDASRVVLEVTDLGPGVPLADRERIFEVGVRLADGRPGQGLGLAIARAIAEAHDGTLELDISRGPGATFRLALPLASGAA